MLSQMVCESLNKTRLTTSSPAQFVNVCVCLCGAAQLCYLSFYQGDLHSLDQLFSLCKINPKSALMVQTQEVFSLLIPLSFTDKCLAEMIANKFKLKPHLMTLDSFHLIFVIATRISQVPHKPPSQQSMVLQWFQLVLSSDRVKCWQPGDRRHVHSTSCQKA